MYHEGSIPDYLMDNHLLRVLEKIQPEGLYFSITREMVELLNGTISIRKIDNMST